MLINRGSKFLEEGARMMETERGEKAQRLEVLLQEALKPMTDKLTSLQQEVESLKIGQEELKKIIEKQKHS